MVSASGSGRRLVLVLVGFLMVVAATPTLASAGFADRLGNDVTVSRQDESGSDRLRRHRAGRAGRDGRAGHGTGPERREVVRRGPRRGVRYRCTRGRPPGRRGPPDARGRDRRPPAAGPRRGPGARRRARRQLDEGRRPALGARRDEPFTAGRPRARDHAGRGERERRRGRGAGPGREPGVACRHRPRASRLRPRAPRRTRPDRCAAPRLGARGARHGATSRSASSSSSTPRPASSRSTSTRSRRRSTARSATRTTPPPRCPARRRCASRAARRCERHADVDLAYDFAGDTYDFSSTRFGRDSLDGAGMRPDLDRRLLRAGDRARLRQRVLERRSRWSTATGSPPPTTSSATSSRTASPTSARTSSTTTNRVRSTSRCPTSSAS